MRKNSKASKSKKRGLANLFGKVPGIDVPDFDKKRRIELKEDEEDIREARRILEEVKSGKQKLLSLEEFEKATKLKISD